MRFSYLILLFYLTDEILCSLTPFSSCIFAIYLVLMMAINFSIRPALFSLSLVVLLWMICQWILGSYLSDAPLTLKSLFSIFLLFILCLFGSSLKSSSDVLIEPDVAFIGVVISNIFLLFSLFGWDAASIIRSHNSNRFAGLYNEPSHFALYVGLLWLLAFQLKNLRPWLYVFLLFNIITVFSLTMGAFICTAMLVTLYTKAINFRINLKKIAQLVTCILSSLFIACYSTTDGKPILLYLYERVHGMISNAGTVNFSALAALQGMELAKLSIQESYGIGIGLGNMGFSNKINNQSQYYSKITSLLDGGTLCLHDGSMLANKIISELGVPGIIIIMIAIYMYAFAIRHCACRRNNWYYQSLFAFLLVYLFVRGGSFFTAPCCLAILGLFSLKNNLLCSQKIWN